MNFHVSEAAASHLPDASFHAAFSYGVFLYFPDASYASKVLGEMLRVLHPDGRILILDVLTRQSARLRETMAAGRCRAQSTALLLPERLLRTVLPHHGGRVKMKSRAVPGYENSGSVTAFCFENKDILRSFLRYFRPYRISLIPVVLASVLEMLFNAQIPMSVKFMIDRALMGHNGRIMAQILGALMTNAVVVSVTSRWRVLYLYAKIVGRIVSSVRQRLFEHLQTLSMEFYARTEVGDVMSRFSNDISSVETGLAAGIAWGLQPLMDLLISAVLVFALEWRLAALGILLCPICVLGPPTYGAKSRTPWRLGHEAASCLLCRRR